jgi:hypothetical protein
MLVSTTDHKNSTETLNHNVLCTTRFNICKTSILPTDLIYDFCMILRIKFDYYFFQKMFLKEMPALNFLQYVYHQQPKKFEIGGKIIIYIYFFFFRNLVYFPLAKVFGITDHIFCVNAYVC